MNLRILKKELAILSFWIERNKFIAILCVYLGLLKIIFQSY
jgi:hypothetical protein